MNEATPKTITLEGKEYSVDVFSSKVKHLVGIHTYWKNQLAEQNLEVAKTQAALKSLELELSSMVRQEADGLKSEE